MSRGRLDDPADSCDQAGLLGASQALGLAEGVELLAIARGMWVFVAGAAVDHPGGEILIHRRAPSVRLRAGSYPPILMLVNIDARRYTAPMARPKNPFIDPDVQLLQALGHPTRLAIVRELTGGGQVCACDFTSCCDVSQPTVSHHLRILKEAGVVEAERRGTWIYYRIVPSAAERLRALAGELLGQPQVIPTGALGRPARRSTATAPQA